MKSNNVIMATVDRHRVSCCCIHNS